jgi:hypothetical protein
LYLGVLGMERVENPEAAASDYRYDRSGNGVELISYQDG